MNFGKYFLARIRRSAISARPSFLSVPSSSKLAGNLRAQRSPSLRSWGYGLVVHSQNSVDASARLILASIELAERNISDLWPDLEGADVNVDPSDVACATIPCQRTAGAESRGTIVSDTVQDQSIAEVEMWAGLAVRQTAQSSRAVWKT